jgi:hypothetical protein
MQQIKLITLLFLSLSIRSNLAQEISNGGEGTFQALLKEEWQELFFDTGSGDWTQKWSLDGERGEVKNTMDGMVFSAGPIRGDHGSHAVLWTKDEFEGDVKIELDYTRMDAIDYAVNILYILATGIGEPPYAEDIAEWSDLRLIPYMSTYFRHMNLLHISFAAFPLKEGPQNDYVRARQYPVKAGKNFGTSTRITPDYDSTGLFLPGVSYHFTVIKHDTDLFFEVRNEEVRKLFHWDTSSFEPLTKGRIGIRHMYTRAARYSNVRISLKQ